MRNSGMFVKSKVYGIGFDDTDYQKERRVYVDGVSKIIWYCGTYSVWRNMIRRCYTVDRKSYAKVEVCEEWRVFSVFKEWYESRYEDGLQLDKDIISGVLYSPDTCVLIPKIFNQSLIGIREFNTGTYFDKQRGLWQSYTTVNKKRIIHGRFSTQSEAKTHHLKEKIKYLQNEMKNLSDPAKIAIQNLIDDLENNRVFNNNYVYNKGLK